MTPVVIESPFAGCVPLHRAYLEACIRDCIGFGETPYASHKMLTDALDDLDPGQREVGIAAGLDMAEVIIRSGGIQVFYVDLGWSGGMNNALLRNYPRETRELGDSSEVWQRIFCDAQAMGEDGEAWSQQDTSGIKNIRTTRDLCIALKQKWASR